MRKNSGYLYAIAAAVLFGASTPFSKSLLHEVSPWMLAGILYLGSGVGLWTLSLVRSWRSDGVSTESRLARSDMVPFSVAVVFGGMCGPVFLMFGLSRMDAAATSLLLNFEGVFTALIAWFALKEHFDRRIAWGMAAIVLGGLALSYTRGASWQMLTGPAFVLLACLSWGIDNNFTRKVSARDPLQIATLKSFIAGATNVCLALIAGTHLPSFADVLKGSVIGFLSYGLSLISFVLALRHIGTSRTGAYFSMAPFVGTMLSIAVFGSRLTPQIVVGTLLMAWGVYLHLSETHEHQHTHEVLEHDHRHLHDEHHQHDHGPLDSPDEPHSHFHRHERLTHKHPHFPDIHHRHSH